MTEAVHVRGAGPVSLGPCPAWCTLSQHFPDGELAHADDGYHHRGPQIEVPTSYREFVDDDETVVRVTLGSWTHPLGGTAPS